MKNTKKTRIVWVGLQRRVKGNQISKCKEENDNAKVKNWVAAERHGANPKHEAINPKQIQIPNVRMCKTLGEATEGTESSEG